MRGTLTIPSDFKIGKYEIILQEFQAFILANFQFS